MEAQYNEGEDMKIEVELGGPMARKYEKLRKEWASVLPDERPSTMTQERMIYILIECEYRRRFPDKSVFEDVGED